MRLPGAVRADLQLKVLDPVVSAVPVDVVNLLVTRERPSEVASHDNSVLEDVPAPSAPHHR